MTLLNRLHPWTWPVTHFLSSSRRSTCIINLPSAQLHHHTLSNSNFNTAKLTSHNPRKCVRWSGSSSRNDDVLYTTEDQRKKDHRHCVEMVQTRDFEGYCKSIYNILMMHRHFCKIHHISFPNEIDKIYSTTNYTQSFNNVL